MDELPDDLIELELPDDLEDVTPQSVQFSKTESVGNAADIKVPYQSPYGPAEYAQANPGVWDSIKGTAMEMGGKALDHLQGASIAHLKSAVTGGTPATPEEALYMSGMPNVGKYVPDALKVPLARTLQINPFLGGEAGEKVFETPEMEKAGLAYQRSMANRPEARAAGALFGPKAQEGVGDALGVGYQALTTIGPSLVPVAGGISLAGKLSAKIGQYFPKLAGPLLNASVAAAEGVAQVPVLGTLGAEKGQRQATLEALLSAPKTWDEYATRFVVPALAGGLAGAGSAIDAARQRAHTSRQETVIKDRATVENLELDAALLTRDTAAGMAQRARDVKASIVAIVDAAHVRALADDMERNAAIAKGELLLQDPDATQPLPRHEETEAPYSWLAHKSKDEQYLMTEGPKPGAYYQFDRAAPDDLNFTAEGEGMGVRSDPNVRLPFPGKEGVRPEAQMLPLTKRDVRVEAAKKGAQTKAAKRASNAAVVASETSKTGLSTVIEWSDGKVEVREIDSVNDAATFRKTLAKSEGVPDVALSTKAQDTLSKQQDPLLADTLVLAPKERAEGKTTGGAVENRTAVLMMDDVGGIPYLTSVKDPATKAQMAVTNAMVMMRTKDGPIVARGIWTYPSNVDGKRVETLIALDPQHGLPTLAEHAVQIPRERVGRGGDVQGLTLEEWTEFFKTNKVPSRVSSGNIVKFSKRVTFNTQNEQPKPVPVTKFEKEMGKTSAGRRLPPEPALPFEQLGDADLVFESAISPRGHALLGAALRGGEGGGGGGGRKPPPPPNGPPEPPPDWQPGELPLRDDVVSEGMSPVFRGAIGLIDPANARLDQQAQRKLFGAHHRGPIDLQTMLIEQKGAQTLEAVGNRLLDAIHAASPDAPRKSLDFHADSVKMGQGRMTVDEFVQKYPEAKAAKQIYDDMLRDVSKDEAELIRRGMINPRMETLALNPQYLTTLTISYMVKGAKNRLKFAKSLDKGGVWERAIEGYIADKQKDGHVVNKVDAEVYLQHLIGGSDDPVASYTNQGSGAAKSKKDLPKWLSDVLGQNLSGELAMAHTYAAQKSALARAQVFDAIASRPDWVSDDAQTLYNASGVMPKAVPDNKWLYGALAGKKVHPHIYDVFVYEKGSGTLAEHHHSIANQPNKLYAGLKKVSSLIKGNEIANPATIFNSFIGNWYHMALSGIAPTEFPRYGQNMVTAAKAYSQWLDNPAAADQTGISFLIRDARKYGFDSEGFGATEVSSKEITNIQKTFLKALHESAGRDSWAKLYDGFKAVLALPGKFTSKAGAVLDMTDRMHKVAAGYTLAEQAMRRAGLTEPGVAQKVGGAEKWFAENIKTREDALRWASRRVNRAFPMPDRIGLYPRYASDTAGVVNPYMTYMSEVLRTSAQAPGTVREDPRMLFSLAAWGTVAASMYGIYSAANPVDKKLVEQERKTRKEYSGTYEPAVVPFWFTASNGRPIMANMTPMFDITRYLSGDPTMNVAERVVGNTILAFTDRGILEPFVRDGLATVDPRWESHERKKKIWQAGWGEAANRFLMDSGVLPKLPGKLWKAYNSTNPVPLNLNSSRQAQPWEIPLMQSMGLPVLPQQNPLAKTMQMRMGMQQVPRDVRSRMMEPNGMQTGPIPTQDSAGEDIRSIMDLRMPKK